MGENKKETGKLGEQLAAAWLTEQQMKVLEKNWRHGRCEIDLICRYDELLVFVEVKTRSSERFGSPGHFLMPVQENRIASAAFAYAEEQGHDGEIRFDLIEVVLLPGREPEITHYPDAFYPGDEGW